MATTPTDGLRAMIGQQPCPRRPSAYQPPLRVLILEPDPDEYHQTRLAFDEFKHPERYQIEWASSYAAAVDAVREGGYDICLLDCSFGPRDGVAFLQRTLTARARLPVIILTGQGGDAVDECAIRNGAADYLVKDETTPTTLERAIRHALQRQRSERELRERETKYRLALHASGLGTWELDLMSGRCQCDERAVEIFGARCVDALSPDEGIALIHPDDRQKSRHAWDRALDAFDTDEYVIEGRIVRPDGQVRWIQTHSRTAFAGDSGDQRPIRIIGTVEDVTERKRAEQTEQLLAEAGVRLAASLDYERTLESVAELVAETMADYCAIDVIDDDGEYVRLEVAAHDPANADRARWLHECPLDGTPRTAIERAIRTLQPVLRSKSDQRGAIAQIFRSEQPRRNGDRIEPVSVMAIPLVARDRVLGAIMFVSAESGRRFDETDLALGEKLAARAALAIDNARLYTESQRAIQMRDEVHRVVAHDLRGPLTNIGMLGAVLERQLSKGEPIEACQESIALQQRAVFQMDRLIKDLLNVASLDARQVPLEPTACSASVLIEEAAHMHHERAADADVELACHVPDQLPELEADVERIQQVFSNLIGNALKFTPAGGRIELGAAVDGDAVVFSVTDTGPGIAADHLPHLFERFWQGDKRAKHGVGLGLAICRSIVGAHGGQIWADSEVGHGSTFSFTLPLPL